MGSFVWFYIELSSNNIMGMLIDTHIHVGQFFNQYFSPEEILSLVSNINIQYYVVSSTTQCEEDYEKVLDELSFLVEKDGEKVLPAMWITPEGLKGNIAWYLESPIKWRCIKVHPELHPYEWGPESGQMEEVLDIAKELSVPLLIHTGNKGCSMCNRFEALFDKYPEVTFILAHGRPHSTSMQITRKYNNVFVDSAFMPIKEMKDFIDEKLVDKLLWGTDMCIPKHFSTNINLEEYYKTKLENLHNHCSKEQFEHITCLNACKVFDIRQ